MTQQTGGQPDVTVIVPAYEREDFLRAALESALNQTFDRFEILVGDNSETDRVENVVRSYDDRRLLYHRNRPGLGAQGNWLDLIRRARTPLVASLHDDDVWDSSFLATVVPPMLDDPSISMTFNDFWIIDREGNRLVQFTEHESSRTHRNEMSSGVVDYELEDGLRLATVWNSPQPAYAAVLRRDAVLACDFPEEIDPLYDIWLTYQLIKRGSTIRYEPKRLTSYRVHGGSTTSSGFSKPEDEVFRTVIAENSSLLVADEINAYWAGLRWARATRYMKMNDRASSQRELAEAVTGLRGAKGVAAKLAARSGVAWHALRAAKSVRDDTHGAPGD